MGDEEMALSLREHPDVHPDILRTAIDMARERGGGTMPVGDYDIRRARDMLAGEQSEVARLQDENSKLRIGWWNYMRKRGVPQDVAILAINTALQTSPTTPEKPHEQQ